MKNVRNRRDRSTLLALGIFLGIWVVFSYPFFFQGKIPAPLDFLVNFYAPWDTYHDTPVKNPAISDVVSQIIPWKIFNAQELKEGRIPLWNPYNLAGTPHLGNWQSGVLYPTTLLFLLLPLTTAWSLHVLLQPLLAGSFMILFLRSLKLSRAASLLGAVVFAYGGFLTTWLEWGTLGHALLWLPLAMLSVNNIAKRPKARGAPSLKAMAACDQKLKWLLVVQLALSLSLLAGHPQTAGYVLTATFGFFLFRRWRSSRRVRLIIVALLNCYLIPILLAAPQVLPSIPLYLNSARTLVDSTSWAKAFLIPLSGLLTFFAPDFFGNPVTRNSWSDFSYVEMSGFVGVVSLFLSGLAAFSLKRTVLASARTVLNKFFLIVVVVGLILAVRSPISEKLIDLKIPLISSTSPARIMGVVGFSLAVLAALGMDRFRELLRKKQLRTVATLVGVVLFIFAGMWLWTFVADNPNTAVARRNLIFPTGVFGLFLISLAAFFLKRTVLLRTVLFSIVVSGYLLVVISFDLFRFHHKFTPYTDASLWYPEVPIISELKKRPERSFGLLDANLNLPFRIKSVDGYDPLVQANFIQLTYPENQLATTNRVVGPSLPKGDPETIKLISDLGVKLVIQSNVHGANPWDLRLWQYPDQFKLDSKGEQYQILLNQKAIPEEVEPIGWLKKDQQRLFFFGIVVSGTTFIFTLLYLLAKRHQKI